MKKDYKPTDEVKIINPDNFAYEFDGDVLSNNPDASKPLTVILKGNAGTWSFKYSEVTPQGLKSSETAQQINTVEQPAKKRAYKKKDKAAKPVKEKRKYTRKNLA